MTTTIPVHCRCGRVRGRAIDVSRDRGNRAVCYCKDCQAFARFLGASDVLDAHGGSDIFQMAPSSLAVDEGLGEIACVRLSPKGLFRFYAGCCKTPIGNMVGAKLPFVGLIQPFMDHAAHGTARDGALGEIRGWAHTDGAIGGAPPHAKLKVGMLLHVVRLLLGWKLAGRGAGPLFDANKRPIVEPRVLTREERALLDRPT